MKNTIQKTSPGNIILIGAIAALFQLLILPAGIVVTAGVNTIPASADSFFALMNSNPVMGFLVDDFFSVLLITMYLFICPPLFLILKEKRFTLSFYGAFLSIIAVILTLSSHTGFSLLHLSKQYLAAVDDSSRQSIISAGQAVIAGNIWNSTAGFFSGIFLQGGGLLLTISMIDSNRFHKLTIISGILANGLDLANHLLSHWLPNLAKILLFVGGPFYLIWYFMLFLNLLAIYREPIKKQLLE